MNQNWVKWTVTILIGFAAGVISALTDSHSPSIMDLVRHGSITAFPTITALQMTLKKDLGIGQ